MTRFRRLADDDDVTGPGGGSGAGAASFGGLASTYDIYRGLYRMQSADPASIQKAIKADSIMAKFGTPDYPGGAGGSLASLAGLMQLQAATNHPPSPRSAAGELARLYDLFAQSAKPQAFLFGRRQLMEATLMPAFAGSGPQQRTISTIVQAFTMYWMGVPVAGGGIVTGFLGAPELAQELNAIWASGSNSPSGISKRLAKCFTVATRRVQYTIPPAVVGFMQVFPQLAL